MEPGLSRHDSYLWKPAHVMIRTNETSDSAQCDKTSQRNASAEFLHDFNTIGQ